MKNICRFIRTLFSLAAVFGCLYGCTPAQIREAAPEPIALETAAPEIKPLSGGELIIPMPRNPFRTELSAYANPLLVNTEELRNMYLLVYEPLLRCDAANRIVPSLAEKWSVDDTGRVWTIELRENVVWHADGELLSADDVIHTLRQLEAYGAQSYYGAQMNEIESFEKVDDQTLSVTMRRQGASALYALVVPIISARETEGMNGTGPYKLQTATETMVELTANPQWWRQAPYIQTIRCLARESNEVALSSYEAGLMNFVPTNTVAAGKYRESGITNVLDVMTQDAEVLLVNHSNSALSNIAVRQAIAYALDRSAIMSNVYMNRAAVCDVPVPPDSFLYDSTSKIYDFDLNKAAALLASAGWTEKNEDGVLIKNGRPLTFRLLVNDSTESTYRKNAASIVAAQLLKAGISVEVESARLAIGDEGEFGQRLKDGDFDLAMAGFSMSRSGDLTPYVTRAGARNYGRYAPSTRMVDALQAYLRAVEEKDMRETHAALQKAFVEELPFITLSFRMSSVVYSAKIQNVADIRGSDVLRTVSGWYINTEQ